MEGFSIYWNDLPIKYRIYAYAKEGYAQLKIAKLCKVSPPYVCKVIKELIEDKFLREIFREEVKNGQKHKRKTKPIKYEPTDKEYNIFNKLTNSTSGVLEDPRLNLICIKYSILERPKKEVPGHRWENEIGVPPL